MTERNPILQSLFDRKSVRVYEEKPIPAEMKRAILEAAAQAPSAGCQQLYTILDITDPALKEALAESCDHQPFIAKAPLVLVFCADCRKWYDAYKEAGCTPRTPGVGDLMLAVTDTAIAAQNAVVAAESFGIGSCYIGDIMENCDTQRSLLHLPDYVFPAVMLVFGWPTQQQKDRVKPQRCAMEHIVLEYGENKRTALVVATSGGHEPVLSGHASPYIVADGYDFESRSWGAGHYFTDIAQAKIDYERSCRHPYPLAEGKLRGDEFCTIRWCRDDVAEAFSDFLSYPVPATEKNIDAAIGQLMAHDGFQDRSIEDGWETISAIIDEDALDLGISTKQGADFYRDAFGLSSFTEAVVWPSSDRDAAFVMTSAVDSEDGDLAVYKIDAGLIGNGEVTVDDIERLGGKRELCVYKHGLDGIEAVPPHFLTVPWSRPGV